MQQIGLHYFCLKSDGYNIDYDDNNDDDRYDVQDEEEECDKYFLINCLLHIFAVGPSEWRQLKVN
jgi:hypothetical protein